MKRKKVAEHFADMGKTALRVQVTAKLVNRSTGEPLEEADTSFAMACVAHTLAYCTNVLDGTFKPQDPADALNQIVSGAFAGLMVEKHPEIARQGEEGK